MANFNWSDDLSVFHDGMDDQHKQLIDYINNFYTEVDNNNYAGQKSAFNKVVEYTLYHFAEEERMMEAAQYPGVVQHKMIHQNLVEQVTELGEKLAAQEVGIEKEIQLFLKNWLTAHIKGIDRKYGNYLVSNDKQAVNF